MANDLSILATSTLREALKIIDNGGLGSGFVVDEDRRLVGVLTDGDVRRALFEGADLDTSVVDIASDQYAYGLSDQGINEWTKLLSDRVKILPLVDKNHKLISYFRSEGHEFIPVSEPDLMGNELKYLSETILTGWISSSGSFVEKMETEFALFTKTKHCSLVSNGTAALQLALQACGIGEGDEVIIPDLSFAATINAVLHVGATPVIVDIDPVSWCICPREAELAIGPKTKAVIVVHLCGQPGQMDEITTLFKEKGLFVIEDCAEAHGAKFDGLSVGGLGDVGCFSFFANKIISTGEGGACVTNDPNIHDRIEVLKNHGMSKTKRYWHDVVGYNYRMTNLQAAIGVAQLQRVEDFLNCRKSYESLFREYMQDSPLALEFQQDLDCRERVVWLVSALANSSQQRDQIIEDLGRVQMDVRRFFYPFSAMPIYKKFAAKRCRFAEDVAERGIFLPTFNSPNYINEIEYRLSDLTSNRLKVYL